MFADISYALPLGVRVLARFTGKKTQLDGPYSLGRWGLFLNVVGLVYLTFTSITFNFPTLKPVTSENMNYTSAAVGVIFFIATITWFTTGKRQFTGPQSGGVVIEGAPHATIADTSSAEGEKFVKVSE
jgi:choline transport protein